MTWNTEKDLLKIREFGFKDIVVCYLNRDWKEARLPKYSYELTDWYDIKDFLHPNPNSIKQLVSWMGLTRPHSIKDKT